MTQDEINRYSRDFAATVEAVDKVAEVVRAFGELLVDKLTPVFRAFADLYGSPEKEKYLLRYRRRGERMARRRKGKKR
jgi:hypothetical protein